MASSIWKMLNNCSILKIPCSKVEYCRTYKKCSLLFLHTTHSLKKKYEKSVNTFWKSTQIINVQVAKLLLWYSNKPVISRSSAESPMFCKSASFDWGWFHLQSLKALRFKEGALFALVSSGIDQENQRKCWRDLFPDWITPALGFLVTLQLQQTFV